MITWAGRLIVLYGAAHTVGALVLVAGRDADAWFGGTLWGDDFTEMSTAMSGYWFSLASFGPPVLLLGLTVLWIDRRGITPPRFVAWALIAWTAVGLVVLGPGVGQDLILLAGCALLLIGARRAAARPLERQA